MKPVSVVLGNEQLEFLRRMNKTYVNEEGRYIKFQFTGTLFSEPKLRLFKDHILRSYDKFFHGVSPFSEVQCNLNERAADLIDDKDQLPVNFSCLPAAPGSRLINESLGRECALVYNSYCFIGTISCSSCNFHNNDAVKKFFNQAKRGSNCFVDETGTTFFVLKDSATWHTNTGQMVPKFI
ncbi:hypothetical protein NE237_012156 [Protea cynaroides]|uniref:Uncharacterized protein n=1 Tax=Protea cynaroides TaxID=273540 RepID=A0A9Q0GZA2_9MAGN|nr:hypothetical protein NE237_012156 [Protea cynaroides]